MKKWRLKAEIESLEDKIYHLKKEIKRLKDTIMSSSVEAVAAQRDDIATKLHATTQELYRLKRDYGVDSGCKVETWTSENHQPSAVMVPDGKRPEQPGCVITLYAPIT
jgi:hypothetical protein